MWAREKSVKAEKRDRKCREREREREREISLSLHFYLSSPPLHFFSRAHNRSLYSLWKCVWAPKSCFPPWKTSCLGSSRSLPFFFFFFFFILHFLETGKVNPPPSPKRACPYFGKCGNLRTVPQCCLKEESFVYFWIDKGRSLHRMMDRGINSGWRPAIAFLYLFLFHSLLCLTSFLSQYKKSRNKTLEHSRSLYRRYRIRHSRKVAVKFQCCRRMILLVLWAWSFYLRSGRQRHTQVLVELLLCNCDESLHGEAFVEVSVQYSDLEGTGRVHMVNM